MTSCGVARGTYDVMLKMSDIFFSTYIMINPSIISFSFKLIKPTEIVMFL